MRPARRGFFGTGWTFDWYHQQGVRVMKRWREKIKVRFRKDGTLTWPARIGILALSFIGGLLAAKCGRKPLISWLGENLQDNDVLQSAITLGLFGVIFGLGNWFIKNHDIRKQFKDTFMEKNELLFSNAVQALFDKSSVNDNTINIHGLKEIARLADKGWIEEDRINAVTAVKQDLSGADLNNAVLKGLNLKSVTLTEAFLEGVNLEGVDFQEADLSSAHMRGAILYNACLKGANLSGADLRGADLRGADLSHADLQGANLSGTKLRQTNLQGANLSGTDLRGADLRGADLSHADLQGANLSGTKPRQTNLQGADLRGANLSYADLQGANLSGTKLRQTNLGAASLQGALYDKFTQFPEGFDPERYGLRKKASG